MAEPRAVRIARPATAPVPAPTAPEPRTAAAKSARQPNRAGTQRAVRMSLGYVAVLAALYAAFVGLDLRSTASASTVALGLDYFTVVGVVLGVVGVAFVLSPAPRAVELGDREIVVTERWGQRRLFPPAAEMSARVVRRYPEGFFSSEPTESVEAYDRSGHRRTYLVTQGLLPAVWARSGSRGTLLQ